MSVSVTVIRNFMMIVLLGGNQVKEFHKAAEEGHVDAVRSLIAKGANVNQKDHNNGWTALH